MPDSLPANLRPGTLLVRGGVLRSQHRETCEGIYMTSGYVYDTAEEAESAFTNDGSRYVYSRYANPTVSMFEERLRLIEGAEACRATGSGMAAVNAASPSALKLSMELLGSSCTRPALVPLIWSTSSSAARIVSPVSAASSGATGSNKPSIQ